MNRHLATSLAVAMLMLMSSCIGYDEELIIHENLSGEASVTLTLPNVLVTKWENVATELEKVNIEKRLDKVSGVKLKSYEKTEGRQPTIRLVIAFSSLEKLNEAIAKNPPAAVWAGQFTITKEEGKTKVERKLGVGDAGKDLPSGLYALYKTHFDGTIVATNSKQYNSPAKDVRFRYSLDEMLAQQPVQSTTTAKGWPWTLILICLAAVAGAAWYGWEYFGKKKPGGAMMPAPAPVSAAPADPKEGEPAPESGQATPPTAAPPRRPGPPQPRPPGAPPQS
jgi:hypothetical protein